MSTIVVMPGGFHPFHAGHAALYNSSRRAFPDADVYVAATNDTSTRPFPFAIKEKLAKLAGVEPGHFVQVKSPFQAKEITANFNPEVDKLIFVRSEKDESKPPQAGGVKKDGNPAYLQPLLGAKRLEPFGKHAYMAYLPTVEFGPGMTSATEIRGAWPHLNEKRKTALVMSLYPATQKNPALAANVVKMLDTAMGTEELNEFAPGGGDDDKYVPPNFGKPYKSRYLNNNQFDIWCETDTPGKDIQLKVTVDKYGLDFDGRYWFIDSPGGVHIRWKYGEIPLPSAIDQAGNPGHIHDLITDFINKSRAGDLQNVAKYFGFTKDGQMNEGSLNEFAPNSGSSARWYTDDQMAELVGDGWFLDLDLSGDQWGMSDDQVPKEYLMREAQAWLTDQGFDVHVLNVNVNDDDCDWYIEGDLHNSRFANNLNEFAPDEGGESRKFIPWNEFVDQLKQILHKDFDCKESINMDVIKAKFVPYDPMELGPTQIYSYFERRAGRKGANSVRGQIQVGKFFKGSKPGDNQLMTGYHLLKGTEFERYFDLTFDNLYKIANIIKGNTEGALQMGVSEETRAYAGQQGAGLTASYQRRENQPPMENQGWAATFTNEDYIDESTSRSTRN